MLVTSSSSNNGHTHAQTLHLSQRAAPTTYTRKHRVGHSEQFSQRTHACTNTASVTAISSNNGHTHTQAPYRSQRAVPTTDTCIHIHRIGHIEQFLHRARAYTNTVSVTASSFNNEHTHAQRLHRSQRSVPTADTRMRKHRVSHSEQFPRLTHACSYTTSVAASSSYIGHKHTQTPHRSHRAIPATNTRIHKHRIGHREQFVQQKHAYTNTVSATASSTYNTHTHTHIR